MLFGSPSKLNAKRFQKTESLPSEQASESASKLLFEFAATARPESLLRAIPCHPLSESERTKNPRRFHVESNKWDDDDSEVAKAANSLKQLKDCWAMLRSGVVTRKDMAQDDDDDFPSNAGKNAKDGAAGAVIGDHSWRLLEWFIELFEKEQTPRDDSEKGIRLTRLSTLLERSWSVLAEPYSVSLLSQIKPPQAGVETRSDAETPLDFVFCCYRQTHARRRVLGARLMSLVRASLIDLLMLLYSILAVAGQLISLTSSPSISPNRLLNSISTRMHALSDDVLSGFLDDMPRSTRGVAFKMAVCDRFLASSLRGEQKEPEARPVAKPQARRARVLQSSSEASTPASAGAPDAATQSASQSTYTWTTPSASRILQYLSTNTISSSSANQVVLFHLLLAFGSSNSEGAAGGKDDDAAWFQALRSGELTKKIQDGFGGTEPAPNSRMRDVLAVHAQMWEAQVSVQ